MRVPEEGKRREQAERKEQSEFFRIQGGMNSRDKDVREDTKREEKKQSEERLGSR